jgi:hypothetical protein
MPGYNDVQIEDRLARVPIAYFEEAAAGEIIEITRAPDSSMPGNSSPPTRLSTNGLADAIGMLAQRCRKP